jgi:hypothetical protein
MYSFILSAALQAVVQCPTQRNPYITFAIAPKINPCQKTRVPVKCLRRIPHTMLSAVEACPRETVHLITFISARKQVHYRSGEFFSGHVFPVELLIPRWRFERASQPPAASKEHPESMLLFTFITLF